MPGIKLTAFELKMFDQGLINENGKIVKGAFKDCDYYLFDEGLDKKGNRIIAIGPLHDVSKKSSFDVVVPKSQIDMFMKTKNLMELTILTTAISTAMKPLINYISATSADFTQDIYRLENTVTKGKLVAGELTLRERKEFTAKYFAEEENFFDTPKEIYDEFNKMPTEFLLQEDVLPLMRRELFAHIGIDSINFDTPEAVVSLRAVTTQTVLNLVDVMQEKPELVQPSKTFEGGLREFDGKMEKVGSK